MTTGRINQVAIVSPATPAAKPGAGGGPRGGAPGDARGRGPGSHLGARPGGSAGAEARRRAPTGHPIAPTGFPKGRSAPRLLRGRKPKPADRSIRPPRGGRQPPITPGGGYRLRRAPKCLTDNASHRPTVHKLPQHLQGIGLRGFGGLARAFPQGPAWALGGIGRGHAMDRYPSWNDARVISHCARQKHSPRLAVWQLGDMVCGPRPRALFETDG